MTLTGGQGLGSRNFFGHAEAMRLQFEWQVAITGARGHFTAAEAVNGEPLTATADQILAQPTLAAFLAALRAWAEKHLGATHASSPVFKVYAPGRSRALAREDAPAKWRYLFSLVRSGCESSRITLSAGGRWAFLGMERAEGYALAFNELLVLEAGLPYAVAETMGLAGANRCAELLACTVLLEGMLW